MLGIRYLKTWRGSHKEGGNIVFPKKLHFCEKCVSAAAAKIRHTAHWGIAIQEFFKKHFSFWSSEFRALPRPSDPHTCARSTFSSTLWRSYKCDFCKILFQFRWLTDRLIGRLAGSHYNVPNPIGIFFLRFNPNFNEENFHCAITSFGTTLYLIFCRYKSLGKK